MQYLKKVYSQMLKKAYEDMGTGCYFDQWQWDEGVMMYGFIKAYEATGDDKIIDFIRYWTDYHLKRMDFGLSINTTAPLLGVMKLLEIEPDNINYLSVCKRFADWCISEAPRADLGCFEHSCTANKYPNQVWADTLFMGCIFLVKWGLFVNNDIYIKEALRQFELHYRFLKDEDTKLIYHGYDCNVREQKGVLWGRGNGWLAISAVEVLNMLDKSYEGYKKLESIYMEFIKGIIKFQDSSGGWHTVIDRNDTYIEMSATSAFGYSILKAVSIGILDKDMLPYGNNALKCVINDIDEEGKIIHGSGGTCVMSDYEKYNDIPFAYTYFTQGLAMMLLSETEI